MEFSHWEADTNIVIILDVFQKNVIHRNITIQEKCTKNIVSLFLGECIEGSVGALVVNTWSKERVDIAGG